MTMDCNLVADQQLADRYVLDQLSAEEAERFEDHYMACETCTADLERAEIMAGGFKRFGAEELAKVQVAAASVAWWQRRQVWAPAGAALAAALAAVFALPLFSGRPPADSRVNTPVVYLQPERSESAAPSRQLSRPVDGGPLVLVLELDPPFYTSYQAAVERDGEVLWQAETLELGERDSVTLSLASNLLASGDHLLRLSATSEAGLPVSVGHFAFRILN